MKINFTLLFYGWLILLSGCSVDSGGPPTEQGLNKINVEFYFGSDTEGNGSPGLPYKTISLALKNAVAGDTLIVGPGNYSSEEGEEFPIVLKDNVNIEYDINLSRAIYKNLLDEEGIIPILPVDIVDGEITEEEFPALIEGVGLYYSDYTNQDHSVTMVCGNNSIIKKFSFKSTDGRSIWCEKNNAKILGNILNSGIGGIANIEASITIEGNIITSQNGVGIEFLGNTTSYVRNNIITNNEVGIQVNTNSTPDLGTPTEPGLNTLQNNINCDLQNNGNESVFAIGNIWEIDAFDFVVESQCGFGENVANTGAGDVLFQFSPITESPLFPGAIDVHLVFPERGSIIQTNTPQFVWEGPNNKITMLGLFNRPIEINSDGSIQNITDMVWVWHSGLGNGRIGNVYFEDGRAINGNNITNVSNPTPLERGRTYFWVVWAWSDTGLELTHSSTESDFFVSN